MIDDQPSTSDVVAAAVRKAIDHLGLSEDDVDDALVTVAGSIHAHPHPDQTT
jgi:3-oxoacyl-[acyl-carrier-protein] synthase III